MGLIFEGLSGTGKSTLARMIYENYSFEDVGILANEIQELFGLDGLYRKFIVAALDIKGNFKLSEMLFNCMISGEGMSVGRKNKLALDMIWEVPCIFACTEFPAWFHGAARRMCTIPFNRSVTRKQINENLTTEMRLERANFLKKSNCAYIYWRWKILTEKSSFMDMLPPFFQKAREATMRKNNLLYVFLKKQEETG